MHDLRPLSFRVVLLASVAGTALCASADAQTGPGPVKTLGSGQSLSNSGNITATSNQAVLVNGAATSITNSGLIQATGANGIGVQVVSGGSVGTISNSGTIQTTTSGSSIGVGQTADAATIGTIDNSGLIQSTGTDAAILVTSGGTVTGIVNSPTGAIQAAGTGSGILVAGTVGSISNAGLIQAAGANGIAINNTGTIGSIINSGLIIAPLGTAIAIGVAGEIPNGITNTATGLIQGGPSTGSGVAIDNSVGTHSLAIFTAGTVIGAIKLGPAGDTLNVTGGSIAGSIIGQAGSNDILNFSPSGTFTTGGSIDNVDTVNVNTNTLILQNPVSSAVAFNVASGATVGLNANVGALNFNNAGMVNVGSGSRSITGNYTQAGSGSLGVTVTGPASAGKLTVGGTATIQGGANAVTVHVPLPVDAFGLVGKTFDVLTAGTLVANAAALTARSDNSGIAFSLTDSATDLLLNGITQTPDQAHDAAVNFLSNLFAPYLGANRTDLTVLHFLENLETQLVLHGRLDLVVRVNDQLSFLLADGPYQLVQVLRQLAPSNLSSGVLTLGLTSNALNSGETNIRNRLAVARLDQGQSGLAAGDAVGGGITMWGQPFGSLLNQNAKDGMDGYSVGTYGVTIGGDLLVAPQFRAGIAVTLSNSNVAYNGFTTGSNGSVFNSEFSLYGEWYQQNLFVDGALSFGYNHYTRHDLLSGFGLALDSDSGGTLLSAKVGAGYDWHVNDAVITPYVSVEQLHFNFGSYTTTGGSASGFDQHVSGQSFDVTQMQVGARAAYPFKLPDGGRLTPELHAYYLHDFGSNRLNTTFTSADVAGVGSFTIVGPSLDRDIFDLGLSASFMKGPGWSVGVGYDFVGRASSNAHNFYLNVKINF